MNEYFTPQIKKAFEKRGINILIKNTVKAIIFYALCYFALFFSEQRNDTLTRETMPFWVIFVLILIIPLWLFKFYKFIVSPSFYGIVIDINDVILLDGKKQNSPNVIFAGDVQHMGEVDSCIVTVKSNIGLKYKFVFKRENAIFARDYYSIGDKVYHNTFSKWPISTVKAPPKKFCPVCGDLCADFENECPHCKLPLIDNKCDEEEINS